VNRLSNQVHPVIQTLYPKEDAVFQDDSVPIHKAGTVQVWFEEHEDEHIPWQAQSLGLNNIEPLWSVLTTRVGNEFPLQTSLKQLEGILQEGWYKILLETLQNLFVSIPRMIAAVLTAKSGPTSYE
jgi:hypothetical protein